MIVNESYKYDIVLHISILSLHSEENRRRRKLRVSMIYLHVRPSTPTNEYINLCTRFDVTDSGIYNEIILTKVRRDNSLIIYTLYKLHK